MTAPSDIVNWNPTPGSPGPPDWNQGPPGPAGPAGPIGPPGADGEPGPEGIAGVTGPPGSTGATGAVGPAGPTGPQGLTGPGGVQGPQGNAGAAGPAGTPGAGLVAKGTVATIGNLPSSGNQNGDTYTVAANNHMYTWQNGAWVDMGPLPAGATGPAGPQGTAGTPGATGAAGPQGSAGATGPQGPTGPQGTPGTAGATGPPGPSTGPAGGSLSGSYPNPGLATGVAATNVGTLGGVLGGTLPNPTMAAGAAATNVGTLGGSLAGTLPNPTLAANSVGASQITDGTVGTAELANASVTNAKLAADTARANLLTNGGFEIWQRGTGPFSGGGIWGADRWRGAPSGTDTLSVSKNTATVDSAFGSATSAACSFVLGSGAGNTTYQQYLTSVDGSQFAGRTLTLSIRVSVNVASAVRIATNTGSWVYGQAHTGDGTWQTLTATMAVPGGTATIYFGVSFAASCTAYIDNAMLVVGSVPADYAPLHPADDLARCLRYYEVVPQNGVAASGYHLATGVADTVLAFKAVKPVFPTVTKNGTWSVNNCSQPIFPYLGAYTAIIRTTVTATANYSYVADAASPITIEANP